MSRSSAVTKGQLLAVGAAVAMLAATMAVPALAGAHGSKASARAMRQVKALRQQVAVLTSAASGLQTRIEAVENRKIQIPTSLPPVGRAGGVLTGSYPNPQLIPGSVGSAAIAPGAISSPLIADGSVFSTDIADGTIGGSDLGIGSVGARQLGETLFLETSPGVVVDFTTTVSRTATCPAGTRLVGGFSRWLDGGGTQLEDAQLATLKSAPSANSPTDTWEAIGRANDDRPQCSPIDPTCENGPGPARPRFFAGAVCQTGP